MEYALTGHILGDVLGSPYEFKHNARASDEYSRIIRYEIEAKKYKGNEKKYGALGQPTDDTEMTMALLYSLKRSKYEYDVDRTLLSYMDFAVNGSGMLGTNTKKLFKYKNEGTYFKHYETQFLNTDLTGVTQSNGTLMRCIPLCEYSNIGDLYADCMLSNPSMINIWMSHIYYKLYNSNSLDRDHLNRMITKEYFDELWEEFESLDIAENFDKDNPTKAVKMMGDEDIQTSRGHKRPRTGYRSQHATNTILGKKD